MQTQRINKRKVRLQEPLTIRLSVISITIPKGFKTDGASIPRLFWWLGWKPFDNDTLYPAIIHDFLYRWHFPRLIADLIFLKMMENYGVCWIKRWTYFIAVRLFGRFTY